MSEKKERKNWPHVALTDEAALVLEKETSKPDGLSKVRYASVAIIEKSIREEKLEKLKK